MLRKYSAPSAPVLLAIAFLASLPLLGSCAHKQGKAGSVGGPGPQTANAAETLGANGQAAPIRAGSPPPPALVPAAAQGPKAASAAPSPTVVPPPVSSVPPHPLIPALPPPAPRPAPEAAVPAAPLAATIRAFGLGTGSTPRIARDFSLGPLESFRPAAEDEAAAFKVASSFIQGIGSGKLDKELLLPEARDALSALLAPAGSDASAKGEQSASPAAKDAQGGVSAASSARIGAMTIQGEDASMRVRLPVEPGAPREEGLLSLRKVEDSWYVEALSLDPPSSEALAFSPDSSAQQR